MRTKWLLVMAVVVGTACDSEKPDRPGDGGAPDVEAEDTAVDGASDGDAAGSDGDTAAGDTRAGADAQEDAGPVEWNVEFREPIDVLNAEQGMKLSTTDIYPVDLNGDGGRQYLVTEAGPQRTLWLHECGMLSCLVDTISLGGLRAPVRSRPTDFDDDGDVDVVIADVVSLSGRERQGGQVVLLENQGDQSFTTRKLITGLGRTSSAEPADVDADGDVDIVVGTFSDPNRGVKWLEQKDDGTLERHEVSMLDGATEVQVAELDGDEELEIVGVFSQRVEKIVVFDAEDGFETNSTTIMEGKDSCWGFNGVHPADLDGDGDMDLVAYNGDAFDRGCQTPEKLARHGIDWLENDGTGQFTRHRLGDFRLAVNVDTADFDGDGDLDIVATSQWSPLLFDGEAPPNMIWLENRGSRNFERHAVDGGPPMSTALLVDDWNEDGVPDILAGSVEFQAGRSKGRRFRVIRTERVRPE